MEEAVGIQCRCRLWRKATTLGRCQGNEIGIGPHENEERDCRDHRREPRVKKNALGIEDYGQLPSDLQRRVIAEVEQARTRSAMPIRQSLKILGVPYGSYYRWKRDEAWKRETTPPIHPVQVFEALPEEKAAVKDYALSHADIRHRELAWRMIDEDVAYLSPSTVYRILLEENLMIVIEVGRSVIAMRRRRRHALIRYGRRTSCT